MMGDLDGGDKTNSNFNNDYCENVELFLNEKILILLLIINSVIILLSIFLSNILSYSIIATLCGITIVITPGFLLNYFIFTKYKLLKNINFDVTINNNENEIEEFKTIMK